MKPYVKIRFKRFSNIDLKIVDGHFATPNSHINYYIELNTMKSRQSEAMEAARAMAENYNYDTIVDTIVCMDGMEVIGAYLAEELSRAGIHSMNAHKTIYIVSPEFDGTGNMIFRDNNRGMIRGKYVLLLIASATTGRTIARAVECINYYGGSLAGISAIYSAATKIFDRPINALFTIADIPDYKTFRAEVCPMCKNRVKIDAICNGYGYSEL